MEKDGNEKGQRGSYVVSPLETNCAPATRIVDRKACNSAISLLFFDSDDEDGDSCYDHTSYKRSTEETSIEVECLVLQQQPEQIAEHEKARHESLSRRSDTCRPHLAHSQEPYKAHLRFDERSREQAQLHRLLGDYMLTVKGDRIMDQMEEAVRDDYGGTITPNTEKPLSPLNSEKSQDTDADLADLLASMEGIAHYVAENEMPASS